MTQPTTPEIKADAVEAAFTRSAEPDLRAVLEEALAKIANAAADAPNPYQVFLITRRQREMYALRCALTNIQQIAADALHASASQEQR